ncbi:DUF6483 family protein [Paenibacillus abyssi]|uniref:Uncharacterized protein n=1 Tax=Paenibacillus abyssi TaxID=1340531 RepID=A0A917CQR1_9BACL|nr:DUF6483 family protein [Paenibacillus abyssi]GGF95714.1 hypothetical protein GCM10010916_11280 [Paenibacillus abyssi]
MFQRDYFMRMIEQMAGAIGQVIGLRERKEHLEALQVIDELLDRQFRLNSRLIHSLSDKDLTELLTTNGVTDFASVQAIAVLFKEKGQIYEEKGEEGLSYIFRLKSLNLFLRAAVAECDAIAADPKQEVRLLLAMLEVYELPPDTKRLLLEWYQLDGAYDQAENVLYELLEDEEISAEEAVQFYTMLQWLSDDQLENGGLSREEVEEGILELQKQGV